MTDNNAQRRVGRRRFIQAMTAAGAVGLAGCTGGSSGGGAKSISDTFVLSTHQSGTAAYAASQGLAKVYNENTESFSLEARPSDGTGANVGKLESNDVQMGYIDSWVRGQIKAGNEPYGDLSFEPYQAFHFYTLPWFLVSNTPDIQSIGDIDNDTKIYTGPSGGGSQKLIEHCLSKYTDGYTKRQFAHSEQATALAEKRIDVGVANIINYAVEPGWLQEMKASADLGVLTVPDGASRLKDDPVVNVTSLDFSEFEGYDLFSFPDSINAMTMSFNTVVRDDFNRDQIYEMVKTLHENRESLGQYHALLKFHADPAFWTQSMYEGMAFHPGAADYYEEAGLWKDGWTKGEIDE